MKGISNICSPEPRFGFDKNSESLVWVWQVEQTHLKPNIRIFDLDYSIRHKYLQSSWWPIIFLIFSHKWTSSCSDWSVWTQSATGRESSTYSHDEELPFFQSTIPTQSLSKSMVIHLDFMLLIAIEDTMILKSTKSLKSHIKSAVSPCHVINPWKSAFLAHSSKSIKLSASIRSRTSSMSPDNNQLCKHYWFHRFCRNSISTVSQR